MLALLKVRRPGKITVTRQEQRTDVNQKIIDDLTGIFDKYDKNYEVKGIIKPEDVSKIPFDKEFVDVLKANGGKKLPSAITEDKSGELFEYLLDLDQDKYLHQPDFVPCVRALTRMEWVDEKKAEAGVRSQAMLSLGIFLAVAILHMQLW